MQWTTHLHHRVWGQRREKGAREGDTKPRNKEEKTVTIFRITTSHVSRFHDFCPRSMIAETQWVHKGNPSIIIRGLTKQVKHCDTCIFAVLVWYMNVFAILITFVHVSVEIKTI